MTDQPANPLDNQTAIAQLASSSDERFNRMQELLLSTIERNNESSAILQRTTVKQERHTDEIDTLLGAVSTNEVAIRQLTENTDKVLNQIAEGNQRFEILREEAIADRAAADQRFEAQLAEIRAIGEQNRALLSALASTNSRVNELEQAG